MESRFAYGLSIRSALALPELPPGDSSVAGTEDVVVRFGTVESRPVEFDTAGSGFWSSGGEACHMVEKVGAFLVRGGREVVIDPAPGVEERLLRLSLLGPALGLLLHQRGLLVLHGSVIARRDQAVAFLGKNGWGKSTLAAALHVKGDDLVTDDVTAIRFDADGPSVLAGYPQVKLWPEAATLLGESITHLPVLHPSFDKRAWRPSREFSSAPRRLVRVYVIAPGPAPAIEPLEPRDGVFEMLAHWYGHRFGTGLLHGDTPQRALRQCAQLAEQISMRRVRRCGGSATLVQLADLVDADLRRDGVVASRTLTAQ